MRSPESLSASSYKEELYGERERLPERVLPATDLKPAPAADSAIALQESTLRHPSSHEDTARLHSVFP
jgi:hypothetical protein